MIDATHILNARILIVDDDRDTGDALARVLRLNGFANVAAIGDPQAVPALHRVHHYDLIVLDIGMPGMDGFAVLEALKEFERDGYVPVVALTGEPGHRLRALHEGARDFMRKPVDPEEFLLRVRNLVELRLLYNERTGWPSAYEPEAATAVATH